MIKFYRNYEGTTLCYKPTFPFTQVNSMEQSPVWEAGSSSDGQDFRLLWERQVYRCCHKVGDWPLPCISVSFLLRLGLQVVSPFACFPYRPCVLYPVLVNLTSQRVYSKEYGRSIVWSIAEWDVKVCMSSSSREERDVSRYPTFSRTTLCFAAQNGTQRTAALAA